MKPLNLNKQSDRNKYALSDAEKSKKTMKIGSEFNIDTYRVSQYKGERIVDTVRILVVPKKTDRRVLVYSPKLMADILVWKSDLKTK